MSVEGVERKPEERHIAIVRVNRDLLAAALRFPEGTKILDVSAHMFFDSDDIALKVEHEDLAPVKPGRVIPNAHPMFSEVYHQISEEVRVTEVKFDGWGQ